MSSALFLSFESALYLLFLLLRGVYAITDPVLVSFFFSFAVLRNRFLNFYSFWLYMDFLVREFHSLPEKQ